MIQRAVGGGAGEGEVLGVRKIAEMADDRAFLAPNIMRSTNVDRAARFRPVVLDPDGSARWEHHGSPNAARSSSSVKTPLRNMLSAIERIQRR